jgi:hypothetical protein
VATTCAPKRSFQIWVICANRILVAKVISKILQHTQKLPKLGQITISCQSCTNPPASGNSATLICNLTAQHRLTRTPLHQNLWTMAIHEVDKPLEDTIEPHFLYRKSSCMQKFSHFRKPIDQPQQI